MAKMLWNITQRYKQRYEQRYEQCFRKCGLLLIINNLDTNGGGDEGIRTLDTLLRYTPLAGERLRPLGHVSTAGNASSPFIYQALYSKKMKCVVN